MQKINSDLATINQSMSKLPTSSSAMATPVEQNTKTQVDIPADKKIEDAYNAALPTIKKILTIHQCVKVDDGMSQLNIYALPGVRMQTTSSGVTYPNSKYHMKYHDRNKCVGVRAIDSFAMPALNALNFRAVYFAEDSGETISFSYQLSRTGEGQWLLSAGPWPKY
ncbi:MAG: hypothetical protein LBV49_02015 [Azonexus sp.]|nr:hypothetical protein [Azonexus sp.]